MKRLFLIILLSIIAKTSHSQQTATVLQPDTINFQIWERDISDVYSIYDGSGVFSYNEDGSLKEMFYKYENDNNDTHSRIKYFNYDNLNNLIEYKSIMFGMGWPDEQRYTVTRNGALITGFQQCYFNETSNMWMLVKEWRASFDDNDRIIEDSTFIPNNDFEQLYLSCNNTYEYIDNDIIRTQFGHPSVYNDTTLRITTTLTSDDKKQSIKLEIMTENSFVNREYIEYQYTDSILAGYEIFHWNDEWIPYIKTINTINSQGYITMVEHKRWNGSEYENYKRTLYEYNTMGYPTSIQFQDFSDLENTWMAGTSYNELQYNVILPKQWVSEKFFGHKHLQIHDMMMRNGITYYSRIDFSYKETSDPNYNDLEIKDMPVTICPNPTNSIVNIVGENISTIEVINIIGQTILKSDFNSETITVDLSGQPAGIYFFTIIDKKGNKCTKKVIKES